jgi:hypothetical protein
VRFWLEHDCFQEGHSKVDHYKEMFDPTAGYEPQYHHHPQGVVSECRHNQNAPEQL